MSALRTPRKYKGKPLKIPFSVFENGSARYKVKLHIDQGRANFAPAAAIEEALDHYIIHYFPEFYTALYNEPAFLADNDGNGGKDGIIMLESYVKLRDALRSKIKIATHYPTSPPTNKDVMVFSLRYDIFKTRERLIERKFNGETEQQQMPSFEASLQYFNSENSVGPTEAQTEFPIKKMASTSEALQSVFTKFGKQQKRSKGPQVPMPMDFGFLGMSVSRIMSALADDLMLGAKGAGKTYKFREGDTLTLYFGRISDDAPNNKLIVVPKYAITDIKYLAADKSIAAEHLKIGQLSLIKYSSFLKDPVVIASLKNYESVLKMDKEYGHGPSAFSVDDFFGNTFGIDTSNGLPMEWNTSNESAIEQDDENNALINTAVELGIIDIADTSSLQMSIGAYTTDQLVTLNEVVTNNPDLYQEVFKGQEKKKDEASPDFLSQIQKILTDGPMASMDDNSPVGSFFRHFGIKTLVKEALLCLTFGMNFEIARIVAIIDEIKGLAENGNIVVEFGGSVKGVTKPQIALPSLGDISVSFPMFTITGDIWKMILEMVIESLEKALIQIIAQLTELLRELCDFNNPRSRDYGDTNMGDLIPRAAPKEKAGTSAPDMGSAEGPYDPFNGTNIEEASGMAPDEIFEYVEQLSIILSSMDVCILLTQPSASEEDLVQKILDFNMAYEKAPQVTENLNTFTAIIGFFAELAKIVDVTDLCNEIANEVATINKDNICLTDDDIQSVNMDDMDNIETLLDILQNGLRPGVAGVPEVFKPNLECPDNPNYIEDPTFRKSIYETLNVLVETVELQFSYASESIKNILLESKLVSTGTSKAAAAIGEVLDPVLEDDWQPAPDKAMIDILKVILESLEDVGTLAPQIQACINDNQDILELDTTIDIAVIPQILAKVIEGMETAFAAGGKLGGLIDTLGDLSNAVGDGNAPSPLSSQKVFNKRFLREFKNYILMNNTQASTAYDRFYDLNPMTTMVMLATPVDFKAPDGESSTYNFEAAMRHGNNHTQTNKLSWHFKTGFKQGTRTSPRTAYTITSSTGQVLLNSSTATYAQDAAAKKFQTATAGSISLTYPDPNAPNPGPASTFFNLGALFQGVTGASTAFGQEVMPSPQMTAQPFIDSVLDVLVNDGQPWSYQQTQLNRDAAMYGLNRVFPMANALLTDYVFDYYIKNGIFDAATLQSLNFFHDNENCAPGDTSDLLDVDGIINKMLRMFESLACGSDLPARKKVRLALKYGMYLLFVQIHIAEFIIKNIFVFSATEIDELFGKQFIALYMRSQIENSMANYLAAIDEPVRDMFMNDLTELFQQLNQIQGGITDYAGNVVFNSGEKLASDQATYNKIINYIIGERITDSKSAVNNAIKKAHPNANPKPLEEIFLRSMPAFEVGGTVWTEPGNPSLANHESWRHWAAESFRNEITIPGPTVDQLPRLFITKTYLAKADLQTTQITSTIPSSPTPAGEGPPDLPSAPYDGPHVAHHHPMYDSNGDPTSIFATHLNNDTSLSNHDHGDQHVEHVHAEHDVLGISFLPTNPIDPSTASPLLPTAANSTNSPTAPLSTDYILRYRFWLSFADKRVSVPFQPALNGTSPKRLYALLPSENQSFNLSPDDYPEHPEVVTLYNSQETYLDRDITIDRFSDLAYARELDSNRLQETVLTQEDVSFLISVPEYQEYFTNVFSKEVITMIPIIENFYLTTKYFDEIPSAFKTTKDACLNIVKNTIESDDRYDKTPDMSRTVANTFKMDSAFDSFAREFILLMLIKTPIDILKGILELIDPHVAISKLIKNITGQVFNILSRVFDEILETAEPLQELGIDSGEKLLAIVLCLVDVVMKNPTGTTGGNFDAKKEMEAFFPRITAEGIDLLGSIMGMFMIPPSPLGILYLLLSLINVEIPSFGADTGDSSIVNSEDSSNPTTC